MHFYKRQLVELQCWQSRPTYFWATYVLLQLALRLRLSIPTNAGFFESLRNFALRHRSERLKFYWPKARSSSIIHRLVRGHSRLTIPALFPVTIRHHVRLSEGRLLVTRVLSAV